MMITKINTKFLNKNKFFVILSNYENYDLTGGGPPFGHVRTFHVELSFGRKPIVRNGGAGRDLVRLIEDQGKPIGKRQSIPRDIGHSGGHKQTYLIPRSLNRKR